MAKPPVRPSTHGGQGQLRIIGGEWRSRRFAFPDAEGLRPTPDRVRETLFNWLAPYLSGARCSTPSPAAARSTSRRSRAVPAWRWPWT